ncbi:HAD-IIB family hydrolase [Salinicola avicenniae]|uniref:HAD-IIB family hydrolase n=1 Tax=Salinicola avicenniae TaxID=2916836 RepID=UPI002073BE9E|nr:MULTISPECIES: HAD-IIB family hydrolase [unclassified Salinicola]
MDDATNGPTRQPPPLLIFTDLDGSLLDHDTYDWQPAAAWLATLAERGVPVIPTTSKTRAELLALRRELALEQTPFIAENGAVIGLPPSWQHARLDRDPASPDGLVIKTPSMDVDFIRRRLDVVRERHGLHFRRLGEMTVEEVCELTGLPPAGAAQAMAREGSEPLVWQDDDAKLKRLHETLETDGLTLTRGGRFWHVMGAVNKGQAANWLVARYEALRGQRPRTLGLGDGPNDLALLAATDMAVVIAAAHGQPMPLEGAQVYRTRASGPRGWAEGVSHWLEA